MRGNIFTIMIFYLFIVIYSIDTSKENERIIMNIYYEKDNYVAQESKSKILLLMVFMKNHMKELVGIFLLLALMKKMIINIKMKIRLMLWDI